MALIKQAQNITSSAWKGGAKSGLIAGLSQGIPAAMGIHPFFSRVIGGIVASNIVKNPIDKRIILNESIKEGLYQLLGGD